MSLASLCPPTEVLDVLHRLGEEGGPAFLVGGALRDHCLGREIRDWDVATAVSPEAVVALFPKVLPTGIRHGTVTVRSGGLALEVSTFRGGTIHEDLAHRDFTIDALAYDPLTRETIDPFGGLLDLRRRLVRAVRDPVARFREDPLRTLRALRLSSELGFGVVAATREAIPSMTTALRTVAPERIRDELTRLLVTAWPSSPLRWMRGHGILGELIPELMEGHRKRQGRASHRLSVLDHALEIVDHLPPKAHLRWAGLLHDVGKPRCREGRGASVTFPGHEVVSATMAQGALERLRFSATAIRGIVHLIRYHDLPDRVVLSDTDIRRLLLRVGPEWISDLLALRRADRMASGQDPPPLKGLDALHQRIGSILRKTDGLRTLKPALNGEDVKAILGLEAGPGVGEILDRLLELILEDPSVNTRPRLTQWLRERHRETQGNGRGN